MPAGSLGRGSTSSAVSGALACADHSAPQSVQSTRNTGGSSSADVVFEVRAATIATPSRRPAGEGGRMLTPVIMSAAIEDALSPYNVTVTSLPISAEQIVDWAAGARDG